MSTTNNAVGAFNSAQSDEEFYKDSFNDNSTDTDTDVDLDVDDSFNDKSTTNAANESFNDESTNTDVEVGIDESFNDKSTTNTANGSFNDSSDNSDNTNNSDNSQYFALGFDLEHEEFHDSFNSHEVNVDDESIDDSFNDESDNSTTTELTDSQNDNSDNSITTILQDAQNDKSVEDSFNDKSDHSVDVAMKDMWNDKSSTANNSFNEIDQSTDIADSYNSDVGIDVAISDSLNHSVDGMIAVENSAFDAISAIKDALKGDGMNLAFSVNQISEIMDSDTLNNPWVQNNASWGQDADADGGEAYGMFADDDFNLDSSEDMALEAVGNADAMISQEAFNLSIAMGNNIQFNALDASVVGGNSSMTAGDDLAA